MKRILPLFLLLTLSSCDLYDTMKNGFSHSSAVENNLEQSVGLKPGVGFNWSNGSLTSVSVTFEGIPAGKPLQEIVELTKASVKKEFQQTPQRILVSFSIEGK